MAEALAKFENPPVAETALSVQFARMPKFVTAMAGWFWKQYVPKAESGTQWTKLKELPRIEDQFEQFGEERWGRPGLRLMPGDESQRTQIIRSDDQRMIQVQDSRFVLNWLRRDSAYPSYATLNSEFWPQYKAFQRFVLDAGIGPIEVNQWEVTYVNQVPRGDLWDSPREWKRVLPCLTFPPVGTAGAGETLNADWRFAIEDDRGRLYVGLRHAKTHADEEVMQLTLVARGPIDMESPESLSQGFDLGHEAIVRAFMSMTSDEAHKRWGRKR